MFDSVVPRHKLGKNVRSMMFFLSSKRSVDLDIDPPQAVTHQPQAVTHQPQAVTQAAAPQHATKPPVAELALVLAIMDALDPPQAARTCTLARVATSDAERPSEESAAKRRRFLGETLTQLRGSIVPRRLA